MDTQATIQENMGAGNVTKHVISLEIVNRPGSVFVRVVTPAMAFEIVSQ
jgi:hypothetical protein